MPEISGFTSCPSVGAMRFRPPGTVLAFAIKFKLTLIALRHVLIASYSLCDIPFILRGCFLDLMLDYLY